MRRGAQGRRGFGAGLVRKRDLERCATPFRLDAGSHQQFAAVPFHNALGKGQPSPFPDSSFVV